MKNLFIVFCGIALFGCTEVDPVTPNQDQNNDPKVEGVWNFIGLDQMDGTIKVNGFEVSTFVSNSTNETGTYNFKNDGTVTNTIAYTNNLVITTAGFPQETTEEIPSTSTSGTYVHDADKETITFTIDGKTEIAEVLKLTSDTLRFSYKVEIVESQIAVETITTSTVVTTLAK